jgi:hypothetical protein
VAISKMKAATNGAMGNRLNNLNTNSSSNCPYVFSKLSPAKPTIVYDTYWRFAAERQAIFFRRISDSPQPWTEDEILQTYKFTNAYRAADRVSQYLLRHVIYEGEQSPNELFFRVLLFKIFNRIQTWELIRNEVGIISYAQYSFRLYDSILTKALARDEKIYSAAYIMPSGGARSPYRRKHRMHLDLIQRMIKDELPARLMDAKSMRKAFELFVSYPTIGSFLGYQYVTDLNYSNLTNFSEMEFVTPGPGALDGIHKCFAGFGGLNESEIIKAVADRQEAEFERLGLKFQSLWGRPLQLIDCQNLFCEVSKYARIHHPDIKGLSKRMRIKQRFSPGQTMKYFFPPKWGLNIKISASALGLN